MSSISFCGGGRLGHGQRAAGVIAQDRLGQLASRPVEVRPPELGQCALALDVEDRGLGDDEAGAQSDDVANGFADDLADELRADLEEWVGDSLAQDRRRRAVLAVHAGGKERLLWRFA